MIKMILIIKLIVELAMFVEVELVSFEQELKEKHKKTAMIDDLSSIEKNDTWRLVQLH